MQHLTIVDFQVKHWHNFTDILHSGIGNNQRAHCRHCTWLASMREELWSNFSSIDDWLCSIVIRSRKWNTEDKVERISVKILVHNTFAFFLLNNFGDGYSGIVARDKEMESSFLYLSLVEEIIKSWYGGWLVFPFWNISGIYSTHIGWETEILLPYLLLSLCFILS